MDISLAKEYGWSARSDLNDSIIKTYKNFVKINKKETIYNNFFLYINFVPGDYCEGVIPDPIPNSEVKPFSANGTLS